MGYVSSNDRHVCDGGLFRRGMYFETVAWEIWMPNFSNSPWMRGAPHMLAVAICLMSLRTSGVRPGRPPLGRLRQVQYRRNPARCHLITVAGLTMSSASLHPAQLRDSSTQSPRSASVSRGRLTDLFEHAELVAERQDFYGQLAARPEQREAGQKQGAQEVQHGGRA